MEVGLDTHSVRFQGWAFDEMVKHVIDMGFSKVSVDVGMFEGLNESSLLSIRDKSRSLGITLLTSSPALIPQEFLRYSSSDFDRAMVNHVSYLLNSIKVSQLLGSQILRIFVSENKIVDCCKSKLLKIVKDVLIDLVDCAQRAELLLVLENHRDLLSSDIINLIEDLNKETIGICFDFGNQIALGESPLRAARAFRSHIKMLHVKDVAVKLAECGYYWRSVPLGKGSIPISELYQYLRRDLGVEHALLEISTSRSPTFVPLDKQKTKLDPIYRDFLSFISIYANWPPDLSSYVDRESVSPMDTALQELRHLHESILWFRTHCAGV